MGGAAEQLFGIYFNGYSYGYSMRDYTGAAGAWTLQSDAGGVGSAFSLAAGDVVDLVQSGSNMVASVNGTPVSSVPVDTVHCTGLANLWFGARYSGATESFDYVSVGTPTPEPSACALLATGLLALLAYAWRKRR